MTTRRLLFAWGLLFTGLLCLGQQPHAYWQSVAQVSVAGGPSCSSPTDLGAALIGWNKADTGVYSNAGTTLATDGQGVVQWNDQSGNGHHLKEPTNVPVYNVAGFNGLKTISWTGIERLATDVDSFALGATTTASVFIVGRMETGTGAYGRAVAYLGNGQANDYDNAASSYFLARDNLTNGIVSGGSTGNATAAISLSTNYRLGAVFDGANATQYINNVAQTPGANTASFTSPGRLLVGNDSFTSGGWFGAISEIVVTNTVLSGDERNCLDTYFTTKWALSFIIIIVAFRPLGPNSPNPSEQYRVAANDNLESRRKAA